MKLLLLICILIFQSCDININTPTKTTDLEGHYWNSSVIKIDNLTYENYIDMYFHDGLLTRYRQLDGTRDTFALTIIGEDSIKLDWRLSHFRLRIIQFNEDSVILANFRDTLKGVNWNKLNHPIPVAPMVYNTNRM